MTNAVVVQPTAEFFPDRWDGSTEAARNLFGRVCGYMGIGRVEVELSFWESAGFDQFEVLERYRITRVDDGT